MVLVLSALTPNIQGQGGGGFNSLSKKLKKKKKRKTKKRKKSKRRRGRGGNFSSASHTSRDKEDQQVDERNENASAHPQDAGQREVLQKDHKKEGNNDSAARINTSGHSLQKPIKNKQQQIPSVPPKKKSSGNQKSRHFDDQKNNESASLYTDSSSSIPKKGVIEGAGKLIMPVIDANKEIDDIKKEVNKELQEFPLFSLPEKKEILVLLDEGRKIPQEYLAKIHPDAVITQVRLRDIVGGVEISLEKKSQKKEEKISNEVDIDQARRLFIDVIEYNRFIKEKESVIKQKNLVQGDIKAVVEGSPEKTSKGNQKAVVPSSLVKREEEKKGPQIISVNEKNNEAGLAKKREVVRTQVTNVIADLSVLSESEKAMILGSVKEDGGSLPKKALFVVHPDTVRRRLDIEGYAGENKENTLQKARELFSLLKEYQENLQQKSGKESGKISSDGFEPRQAVAYKKEDEPRSKGNLPSIENDSEAFKEEKRREAGVLKELREVKQYFSEDTFALIISSIETVEELFSILRGNFQGKNDLNREDALRDIAFEIDDMRRYAKSTSDQKAKERILSICDRYSNEKETYNVPTSKGKNESKGEHNQEKESSVSPFDRLLDDVSQELKNKKYSQIIAEKSFEGISLEELSQYVLLLKIKDVLLWILSNKEDELIGVLILSLLQKELVRYSKTMQNIIQGLKKICDLYRKKEKIFTISNQRAYELLILELLSRSFVYFLAVKGKSSDQEILALYKKVYSDFDFIGCDSAINERIRIIKKNIRKNDHKLLPDTSLPVNDIAFLKKVFSYVKEFFKVVAAWTKKTQGYPRMTLYIHELYFLERILLGNSKDMKKNIERAFSDSEVFTELEGNFGKNI